MIKKELCGKIEKYTVTNGNIQVEFLSFGARMTKLLYNGIDILLGYDNPEDYLSDSLFIGATVGRFAGRIGKNDLKIFGNDVHLDQNENGTTCHHGGYNAFDKQFWSPSVIDENTIVFSRTSADGEGGFPGNLEISVRYRVLSNGVEIYTLGKCDKDTIVNLTNHAYFNLNGYDDADARELRLVLPADHYLPLNEKLIPTGEIAKVCGTNFDFTKERKIEADLDHYFVYENQSGMRYGGSLYSPKTKIRMNIETDRPGIQIYTCGAFEASKGKGGIPLHKNQGIALETQGFPDNPNHENFPKTYITDKQLYIANTRFLFSME